MISIPSQADILKQIMDAINPVKKDVADLQIQLLLPVDVRKEVESALENVKLNIQDLQDAVDSIRRLISPRTMQRINNDFDHLFDQYDRIELLLMSADAKKGEGFIDKEADQSSASHHLPHPEIIVIDNPDPVPKSVRVSNAPQRQTTASAAADKPIDVAAFVPPPPPKLTPAQALKQLQQKQSSSTSVSLKRPRIEEKEMTKEKRQRIKPINASDVAFNTSLAGSQRLSTYMTLEILKSHAQGVQLPKTDLWVPDDLNQWWEELKEIYLKWHFVCANLKDDLSTCQKSWDYFLARWTDRREVQRVKKAAVDAKLKVILPPKYRVISCPKVHGHINREKIKSEAELIALEWKKSGSDSRVSLLVKDALFKIYGQRS